jgi:hypothetical protein
MICAVSETFGNQDLMPYLQDYRERHKIPRRPLPCTLAFDATPITATGLQVKGKDSGSCFAFFMLPLDHRCPDLLVRSIAREHGKITLDILRVKDDICTTMEACGFMVHFVATDGDNGMEAEHVKLFQSYISLDSDIRGILAHSTQESG